MSQLGVNRVGAAFRNIPNPLGGHTVRLRREVEHRAPDLVVANRGLPIG
jgi:hypothetical protein